MNNPYLRRLFADFDNSFDLVDVLGKGAFGITYFIRVKDRVILPKTLPRMYALKLYDLSRYYDLKAREEMIQSITTEATIILGQSLRNVITYYGLYPVTIQNYPYLSVCMEYIDGVSLDDMREHISSIGEIDGNAEYPLLLIFREVIYGVHELHSRNIAHRDIKPENILVKMDEAPSYDGNQVKIIDLGFACSNPLPPSPASPKGKPSPSAFPMRDISCRNVRGTPYYSFSPEFLALIPPTDIGESSAVYNNMIPMDIMFSSDIWAIGNTLFYFVYQKNAFEVDTDDFRDLADAVLNFDRVEVVRNDNVPKINWLIDRCLLPVEQRPNADQLLQDIDVLIEEALAEEEV